MGFVAVAEGIVGVAVADIVAVDTVGWDNPLVTLVK